ncbi:MAG: EAL domain-containing protein [Sulfurospirillaceae bacterium]|nr:EAL domain-containing protein [Sulfurospirillaceae bacterium]
MSDIFSMLYLKHTKDNLLNISNSFNMSTAGIIMLVSLFITMHILHLVPIYFLLCWITLNFLLIGIRLYYAKALSNELNQESHDNKRVKYFKNYLISVFASGALWGLFFVVCFHYLNRENILFLASILFALLAGAIMTIGSSFLGVFLYNIPIVIPTIIALLLKPYDIIYILEALILAFFVYITLKISYKKQVLSLEMEQNLDLMRQHEYISNQNSIISKTDTRGVITYANDNFCKVSGYSRDELVGHMHNIIRHPDMPKSTFEEMWRVIKKEKKTWQGIIKNMTKSGEPYYLNATISPIFDSYGNIKEYIALRHDISSIMSDKKQLFNYLEVNKLSFLVMIQIEDYDMLEKFYDKANVEKIEKKFGEAILHMMSGECKFQKVYHLESGLYALAKDRRTCQISREEIEKMLEQFLQNVKSYVVKLDEIEYDISAICSYTYGVHQTYEDAKIGIEKAIKYKEQIVYADGLSCVEHAIALNNIETLRTLKVAIDGSKIISYFQPIINNHTGKVEKYESLVRLIDDKGNIISPAAFLDIAKKGRYYAQVTMIVLKNSFKILRDTDKEISINLSAVDIETDKTREEIFKLLREHSKDASRIVFELLESEDVKDENAIISFIKQVKPLGVKIAIDDFGTGYSNFERLLQYEPDLLKIDGSLIKNIKTNPVSLSIIETIVIFAKKQNIKTVAEFVENKEIHEVVKNMGIDYSQGYAFGKPEELIKD